MELTFLGSGDAWNYLRGNNAAYFKRGSTLYFLDMGQSIFTKALHEGILEGAQDVVIFITHCHFDHIGSLGEAITYFSIFHPEVSCTIVYPDERELKEYLRAYPIKGIAFLSSLEAEIFDISYKAVTSPHGDARAFSYFLKSEDTCIYYSGDNALLNQEALEGLRDGTVSHLYQDASSSSSIFHLGLDDIAAAIELALRERVTLMHLPEGEIETKAKALGFLLA